MVAAVTKTSAYQAPVKSYFILDIFIFHPQTFSTN